MSEYKYFCPMRPPSLGAVPKKGLQYVESFKARKYVKSIGRLAWGYVVYNRKLTTEEILFCELEPAPGDDGR